ncbi:MAG TPA: gamma-glutamyl-gamma-aminobutyrate hydrolase family protein [Tenuifilaceae bacterium]|nr:gamma-glutamyl-gamma-aminobutyrate hydrolase family protein [Tenuifilaceae bacterium]
MKKLLTFLLLAAGIASLFTCSSPSQKPVVRAENSGRNIVLLHPTVNNLKTFLYLTKNNVFTLPKDYGVIGVFHSKEKYDYSQSLDFIEKEKIGNFHFTEISAELNPENIYKENSGSPQFYEIFNNSQGAIFFGGPDMPPACYGEETNLLTEITDPHRHYLELSFLFHLLGGSQDTTSIAFLNERNDYTILGICLGMQSMNVATGGTMVQDIPTELFGVSNVEQVLSLEQNQQHRNYYTNLGTDNDLIWGNFHQVKFLKGSFLDSINGFSGNQPYVLSSHHQCIENLGLNLTPIAWSVDGRIVEAVKHTKFPNVIGVQFHPEPTFIYDSTIKFRRLPNESQGISYLQLYPNEKGENFHRAFWKYLGKLYQN